MELIPAQAATIVDVGYDHGHLINMLLQDRSPQRIFGIEKQRDAAGRFWAKFPHLRHSGQIFLYCGDGLAPLKDEAIDTAVFAGINEGKIAAIVRRSPQVLAKLKRMVFAPQDFRANLRQMLYDWNWQITDERIAWEKGRYYGIFAAQPGRPLAVDRITHHFGPKLFERRDPLLHHFLVDLRRKLAGNIAHLNRQPPALRSLCLHIDAAIELAAQR